MKYDRTETDLMNEYGDPALVDAIMNAREQLAGRTFTGTVTIPPSPTATNDDLRKANKRCQEYELATQRYQALINFLLLKHPDEKYAAEARWISRSLQEGLDNV